MKICKVCNKELQESDFYKGHARCKKCYIKIVKKYREVNHDKVLNYDKLRNMNPSRVKARNLYSQTDAGKEACMKAKIKWTETNVIKRAASLIVGNAVRDGKLVKQYVCEHCRKDKVRIHGHHDDYAFPLSVRWLCSKCHTAWHKENGSGRNG